MNGIKRELVIHISFWPNHSYYSFHIHVLHAICRFSMLFEERKKKKKHFISLLACHQIDPCTNSCIFRPFTFLNWTFEYTPVFRGNCYVRIYSMRPETFCITMADVEHVRLLLTCNGQYEQTTKTSTTINAIHFHTSSQRLDSSVTSMLLRLNDKAFNAYVPRSRCKRGEFGKIKMCFDFRISTNAPTHT